MSTLGDDGVTEVVVVDDVVAVEAAAAVVVAVVVVDNDDDDKLEVVVEVSVFESVETAGVRGNGGGCNASCDVVSAADVALLTAISLDLRKQFDFVSVCNDENLSASRTNSEK